VTGLVVGAAKLRDFAAPFLGAIAGHLAGDMTTGE
jgi:hypothetical protein